MSFIHWSSLYVIGVDTIDEQHHKMFILVNELFNSIQSESEKEIQLKLLDELIEHAKIHFSLEESLLEKNSCPKDLINEHKQAHAMFKYEIIKLYDSILNGGKISRTTSLNTFRAWMIEHTQLTDSKYVEYFKGETNG